MVNKEHVITRALLLLGENNGLYSNNLDDTRRVAEALLNHIVENVAADPTYLFNATSVKLARLSDKPDEMGRYRFGVPLDYMSTVRSSIDIYREGSAFFGMEKEGYLTYCRKIGIGEFPDSLCNYLVARLGEELALSFAVYSDKYAIMSNMRRAEEIKIKNSEGLIGGDWHYVENK